MYAIIESGGKQQRVEKGDRIKVEKLDVNVGDEVTLPVLLISDEGSTLIGQPHVEGAQVEGRVIEQGKDKKVVVFHYKPKKDYRKKAGHRQPFTKIEVTGIVTPGGVVEAAAVEEEEQTEA